jgi:signal transduction histidine kinase
MADEDLSSTGKYVTAIPGIEVHRSKILIIDDEESGVRLLERILKRAQIESVTSTTDPRAATTLFQQFQPDLVLTDLLMPHLENGLAVIEQLRDLISSVEYLPIVVLTADVTKESKRRALAAGATEFLTKPFDVVEVLLRISNLLQARLAHLKIREQNAALEENVRLRTLKLEEAFSELNTTQQKLIQQERLAALGTMARRIAQDFNNALALIIGFGEELLREAEHGLTKEKASPSITEILTAAQDAVKIVYRLREFSRPGQTHELYLPVNVNDLIQQAVLLTKPKWQMESLTSGTTIRLSVDFGEIPTIDGDPAELREALTGLIFNAIEAMPHGGSIMLRTRAKGDTVTVQITDTGIGMTEEERQRCLEPFFTTKTEPGTGLGLDMVFAIVRRHQGVIDIESQPGNGTTFTLHLPVSR